MSGWEHQYYPQAKTCLLCHTRKGKRPRVTCPVCFESLVRVSSLPKTSMLSKTKQQDRHTRKALQLSTDTHVPVSVCQFVPYPGTVHCTEQERVHVPGTEVAHIYMGHKSHIYIQWWSLTRLGSHRGTSDKKHP